MLPYRDSRFATIVLTAFFLLALGYAYFEGRGLLYGPAISIEGRVMEVTEPLIMIEGVADRIASLTMNGQTILVTEGGEFSEPYLLAPGYNRIILVARDRYGKKTQRSIEIMYTAQTQKGLHSASPPEHVAPTE